MSLIASLLFQACNEQRILRIGYCDKLEKRTVREIDVYWMNDKYIDVVCRLRGALLSFRIDRIEHAELLPETFERDPELAIHLKLAGFAAPKHVLPAMPGPRHPLTVKESA